MERIKEKIQQTLRKRSDKEKFEIKLNSLLCEFNEQLQEVDVALDTVHTAFNDKKLQITESVNRIKQLRVMFFEFCCQFDTKEDFDKMFSLYRVFLRKYNDIYDKAQQKVIDEFSGELVELSRQIRENRSKLLLITNENISEHNVIHKHNEPFYKEIEQLEEKWIGLLENIDSDES